MDKSTTLPLSHQPTVALPAMAPPAISVDDTTTDDAAPSRLALLQRAAELGPGPRLSLDNIGMAPTDPVLAKKREPGVIERRARFRRVVKVALGLCAGFCLVATAATALSSSKAPESAGTSVAHSTAPASVVSEKETLEVAVTTKAEKATAEKAPAPAAPARGRWAKRR
ncbi:MAG: hypothetical protein U0270_09545 [Labilithrix sp.]